MLEIKGVHSGYGTATVLRGVDLQVDADEVVGLLGRNGMGKTTLVRTIARLDPPQLREGEIRFQGEVISNLQSHQVGKMGIGLVPQGRHIFGTLTVLENLTVAARGATDEGAWNLERVLKFFPRLGDRINSRGRNLSGGEQQMLAIGRALMINPRLLLMDEPSEGLAPIVLRDIREGLQGLKGSGLAILLVEQNLGLALRLCDRLYVLGEGGTIAWMGTPEELEAAEEIKQKHLGV